MCPGFAPHRREESCGIRTAPAHLYLKRAKADQVALGTPGDHRAILSGLVDLSM